MKGKKKDCLAFLKKSGFKASEGKQVYISKETHAKVSMLVRLLGGGEATVSGFIESVVSDYLHTHRDELNRMLDAADKVEL